MSKSERRRTESTIAFRVAPEEETVIQGQAERYGLSPGQYAKRLALADAALDLPEMRRRPPRDAVALRKLVGNLGMAGNNLNQLARVANTHNEIDAEALARALQDLAEIRAELIAILRVHDP